MYNRNFGKQLALKHRPSSENWFIHPPMGDRRESLSETIFTGLMFLGACTVAILIATLSLKGSV